MEEYKDREYCKNKFGDGSPCYIQEVIEGIVADPNLTPGEAENVCKEACEAYKFHDYLQENGYEIVKKEGPVEYAFTERFDNIMIDFYKREYPMKKLYIKRVDVGRALQYPNPCRSASKLHSLHKEEFNQHSVKKLLPNKNNKGQLVDMILYDRAAVSIFCNYSKKPKAEEFYNWVTMWL